MEDALTFNWLMQPQDETQLFRDCVDALTSKFSDVFDQVTLEPTSILCIHCGFNLVYSLDYGENQIHPETLSGAGEVTVDDGHLPILFFATLQKIVEEKSSVLAGKLTFSTQTGESIRLDNWSALRNEYTRLGIFEICALTRIRSDAEAVGFVDPVFQLEKLGVDAPLTFF